MTRADSIREMLSRGVAQIEVARKLGAHPSVVCRIARQMGMPSRAVSYREWSGADISLIATMTANGSSQGAIGRHFGVSTTTICKLMQRHGIKSNARRLSEEEIAARFAAKADVRQRRIEREERRVRQRDAYRAGLRARYEGSSKAAKARDQVRDLRRTGLSAEEVAARTGYSVGYVRSLCAGMFRRAVKVRSEPKVSPRAIREIFEQPVSASFGSSRALAAMPSRPVVAGPFSGAESNPLIVLAHMRADAAAAQARMAAIFDEGDDEEIAA